MTIHERKPNLKNTSGKGRNRSQNAGFEDYDWTGPATAPATTTRERSRVFCCAGRPQAAGPRARSRDRAERAAGPRQSARRPAGGPRAPARWIGRPGTAAGPGGRRSPRARSWATATGRRPRGGAGRGVTGGRPQVPATGRRPARRPAPGSRRGGGAGRGNRGRRWCRQSSNRKPLRPATGPRFPAALGPARDRVAFRHRS